MNFLRKIFGGGGEAEDGNDQQLADGGLELLPASVTQERAEAALPGTAGLKPILTLEPPPVTLDRSYGAVDSGERDYKPNPDIKVVGHYRAAQPFTRKAIEEAVYGGLHARIHRPTLYVKTPEGHTTFLTSSEAPEIGVELLAAWMPNPAQGMTPDQVLAAHLELTAALKQLHPGFSTAPISSGDAARKFELVEQILALSPDEVAVVAYMENNSAFGGRRVWDLLHAMGFKWGDMDCFQWPDPTGQTDYLLWVTADDHELGYVLPELIAGGSQNFREVRFSLVVPRTPSPSHVLGQMLRAASAFQHETGCQLAAFIDGEQVEGPAELTAAVATLEADVRALGLLPGSSAITMLR